jgi:hypothetical protein
MSEEESYPNQELERLRRETESLSETTEGSDDWGKINEIISTVRTLDPDDMTEIGWMQTQFIAADGRRIAVPGEYDTREYHSKVARRLGCRNTRQAQEKLYLAWVSVTNDRSEIVISFIYEPTQEQLDLISRAKVVFPKANIKIRYGD